MDSHHAIVRCLEKSSDLLISAYETPSDRKVQTMDLVSSLIPTLDFFMTKITPSNNRHPETRPHPCFVWKIMRLVYGFFESYNWSESQRETHKWSEVLYDFQKLSIKALMVRYASTDAAEEDSYVEKLHTIALKVLLLEPGGESLWSEERI